MISQLVLSLGRGAAPCAAAGCGPSSARCAAPLAARDTEIARLRSALAAKGKEAADAKGELGALRKWRATFSDRLAASDTALAAAKAARSGKAAVYVPETDHPMALRKAARINASRRGDWGLSSRGE